MENNSNEAFTSQMDGLTDDLKTFFFYFQLPDLLQTLVWIYGIYHMVDVDHHKAKTFFRHGWFSCTPAKLKLNKVY